MLIDFAISDLRVLSLAARHFGSVLVARPLLREVDQLDEPTCVEAGITLVDPTLEQVAAVGSVAGGPLSFHDRLCLILARDRSLICVTNDRRLRSECTSCGVEVLWGLELMAMLVRGGNLSGAQAIQVAEKIHASNPRHITKAIVERFKVRVRTLGRSSD